MVTQAPAAVAPADPVAAPLWFRHGDDALPAAGGPGHGPVVQLWLIDLASSQGDPAALDEEERRRARAFVREADRIRYRAAHIALRELLGAFLGLAPAVVALSRALCPACRGPHGRPVVAGSVPGAPHFSLSYAGDTALAAFAVTPVGVDIERVPSLATAMDVADTLHPLERAELLALPEPERPRAFARCWTRKEAYLKGTGLGLTEGADEPYVGCAAAPVRPAGWAVHDLAPGDGLLAAVAVETVTRRTSRIPLRTPSERELS
ncbi:4'-phosphopantetheinyl transferase family protein [Streptomyces sp. NPDC059917]|uniref:4'-phosphopantetheinyl transferase family protein n=1 Tax=Streptomyces sp. NPDC059917 TaxID=3347002 RepID=UPI0036650D86